MQKLSLICFDFKVSFYVLLSYHSYSSNTDNLSLSYIFRIFFVCLTIKNKYCSGYENTFKIFKDINTWILKYYSTCQEVLIRRFIF